MLPVTAAGASRTARSDPDRPRHAAWYRSSVVTRETASLVRDTVVETIDPIEIILFGSVAQTASGDDLDLLIVTEDRHDSQGNESARELTTALRSFKRTFDIDHYVLTRSQFAQAFRRGSVFLRKIVSEGICIYMREGIRAWIQQAEEDLRTAEYLRSGGFFRGACYHAQQSVEKSIKAMLLDRGWDLEKIHSIHRLLAIADDYRLPAPLQPADVDFMDEIYRGRYPAESGLLPLGTPTSEDAGRAVSVAKQTLRALRLLLTEGAPEPPGEGECAPDSETNGATERSGS